MKFKNLLLAILIMAMACTKREKSKVREEDSIEIDSLYHPRLDTTGRDTTIGPTINL
jgi:hypothetical protein